MENKVLNFLEFRLSIPTTKKFLRCQCSYVILFLLQLSMVRLLMFLLILTPSPICRRFIQAAQVSYKVIKMGAFILLYLSIIYYVL